MKKVLIFVFAALFLLNSGIVLAKQGKGKAKGPDESAYEHADEKAKFLRDESTSTEKGKDAAKTKKEKGKDAAVTGEDKKKEIGGSQKDKNIKAKEKEYKTRVKKGGKGKKDIAE